MSTQWVDVTYRCVPVEENERTVHYSFRAPNPRVRRTNSEAIVRHLQGATELAPLELRQKLQPVRSDLGRKAFYLLFRRHDRHWFITHDTKTKLAAQHAGCTAPRLYSLQVLHTCDRPQAALAAWSFGKGSQVTYQSFNKYV